MYFDKLIKPHFKWIHEQSALCFAVHQDSSNDKHLEVIKMDRQLVLDAFLHICQKQPEKITITCTCILCLGLNKVFIITIGNVCDPCV